MAVHTLTKENFEREAVSAPETVLIDFWAPWCGPCRMVSPIVDEVAEEVEGRVKVAKVNVDEQPRLAERFQVMTIPTLMVFRQGKTVATRVGVQNKQALLALLEEKGVQ